MNSKLLKLTASNAKQLANEYNESENQNIEADDVTSALAGLLGWIRREALSGGYGIKNAFISVRDLENGERDIECIKSNLRKRGFTIEELDSIDRRIDYTASFLGDLPWRKYQRVNISWENANE